MALLPELEKIADLIRNRNSEFRKLDRIDGLLCLTVMMDKKSCMLINSLVDYLKEIYNEKGILIDSEDLMKELNLWLEYSKEINLQP